MGEYYLAHHGILGQKWGRMQGPPYPLDSSDHSSAEKSAAKSAGVSVGKSSGKGSIESARKMYKIAKKNAKEEFKKEAAKTWDKDDDSYDKAADKYNKAIAKAKADKKMYKIQQKIDKENSSWDKFDEANKNAREKNRAKLENKYDKKIEKASDADKQKLEDKKNAKLKDFDEGTSMISKASSIGRENTIKYLNMKKDAVVNSDLKNSYEYNQAKRWYNSQKIQESGIFTNTPGKSGAVLQEAYANARGKSSTRGVDTRQKNIDKITNKAESKGGHINKSGKYVASNGVVIAKSRDKGVAVARKVANSGVGYAISKAGTGSMAKMTGRSKESIRNQAARERAALKEYWSVGGDKMLNKYNYYKN